MRRSARFAVVASTVLAAGAITMSAVQAAPVAHSQTAPGCPGPTAYSNGHEGLEQFASKHHSTVSEMITYTFECHVGGWPKGLALYVDRGYLHRAMPPGIPLWTTDNAN